MLPEFAFANVLLESSGLRGEGVHVGRKGMGKTEKLLGGVNACSVIYASMGWTGAGNGSDGAEAFAAIAAASVTGEANSYRNAVVVEFDGAELRSAGVVGVLGGVPCTVLAVGGDVHIIATIDSVRLVNLLPASGGGTFAGIFAGSCFVAVAELGPLVVRTWVGA